MRWAKIGEGKRSSAFNTNAELPPVGAVVTW